MRRLFARAIFLTVLAAGTAVRPADAQCRLCTKPSTALGAEQGKGDVTLEIESGLDFDRLILLGQGDGSATLRPDGSNGADGAVGEPGPRAMVGSARVHGEANRLVRVELPRRIDLYSLGGGRISVDDVISDLPSQPRLDGAGNLNFRFGGRVRITGDADGRYRGDLPITVEYL
jgi:hypothetical protein